MRVCRYTDFCEARCTRQVLSRIGYSVAKQKFHSCILTVIETCLNGKVHRFTFWALMNCVIFPRCSFSIVRATCNPDVDSWVAKFIAWWIDQETGYPIPERSGVLRYFCRENVEVKWGDSPEELSEKYGVEPELCKSVTFIASSVYDNKILLERDPSYLANLRKLDRGCR